MRKRFGFDPWEQPIPKRWKADVFRDVVSHGQSIRIVHSRVGSSHLGEPIRSVFFFMGTRVGSFVLGVGSLILVRVRELADHQVAQSHASRRSACRFLSVINV